MIKYPKSNKGVLLNWLAHIFLSEQNIDFQMGNYLADPLKGRVWEEATDDLKKGMQVHMIIDSFTDTHPLVIQSKHRLREKGLLKSIVIDITYDYFLTKNWNMFCNIPFELYTQTFYKEASQRLEHLAPHASKKVASIIKYQVLHKYQTLNHLKTAFERIDKRLSTKLLSRDKASSYFEAVEKNIEHLEEDFLYFFPKLCDEVRKNVDEKRLKHWKI